MFWRRGVLASLLLLFLLLPPSPSEGQVVSGAILLSRAVVYGSKIIRVSLPFSVSRLKSIYQSWKNAGRPSFSRLRLVLGSAILYIGASKLLSDFENIYQNEQSSYIPANYSLCWNYGPNITSRSDGCPIEPTAYGYRVVNNSLEFLTSYSPPSPCVAYVFGNISLLDKSTGQVLSYNAVSINPTQDVLDFLTSIPVCSQGVLNGPYPNIDAEFSRALSDLLSAPIEAYPSSSDPAYTDVFDIPLQPGDSATIIDTQTGQTTTETVEETADGSTNTSTTDGQLVLPDDNQYDPTIDIPDKKDISALIDTFVNSSPLMRWIQRANISATPGACSVSGTFLNKSFVLDFCPLAPYLNQIGAFILAFAHIYALYIIFRIR